MTGPDPDGRRYVPARRFGMLRAVRRSAPAVPLVDVDEDQGDELDTPGYLSNAGAGLCSYCPGPPHSLDCPVAYPEADELGAAVVDRVLAVVALAFVVCVAAGRVWEWLG